MTQVSDPGPSWSSCFLVKTSETLYVKSFAAPFLENLPLSIATN